ncbi:MAG: cytochrome c biogenesis protein CcsA [Chlorobi bacterium]|nr:cytochrome c biogenesis protein CcsA [Chlorobiota bacterium]
MLAQFIVHLCLGLAIGTSIGYWYAAIKQQQTITTYSRYLFFALCGSIAVSAILLLHAIVTNDFDITYVQSYSSRQLESPFLYAAFYSGQEGSFLLWTLLTSIVGIATISYSKRRGIEADTMAFFSLVLVFLTTMLVAKNPFSYLWETYAEQGTTREFIEALKNDPQRYNGRGLNPVLQNYWVMIHPPMLFSGFAMMTAPFALAMAGLLRRQYHRWIEDAQPWINAATFVLGIGIVLGGFWAYETLGWGGFWAWDPVENSSLVPWLLTVALLHTTLIQRRNKGLVRTNFLLTIAAFCAVLYSTFLTRSGVLGDTSVHSFVEPGFFVYVLLLVFLGFFLVLGIGLLIVRFPDLASASKRTGIFNLTSREFLLSVGVLLIITSAIIVVLGTSYPIVAELIGQQKAAIEARFYNTIHAPLLALVLLTNGISLVATWQQTNTLKLFRTTSAFGALGIAISSILYAIDVIRDFSSLVIVATAIVALAINIGHIIRLIRGKKMFALGAFLSHAGLGIFSLGIVVLASKAETSHVRLVEGKTENILNYNFTLEGKQQLDTHLTDREKYRYLVAVEKNGIVHYAYPVVYFSDFNRRQAPFFEPGILSTIDGDLYIAPKALDIDDGSTAITLFKRHPQFISLDTNWRIELIAFDMSRAQQGMMSGQPLPLGVAIRLHSAGSSQRDTTLFAYFDGQAFTPEDTVVIGQFSFWLENIRRNQRDPDSSTATVRVKSNSIQSLQPRQVLITEVSKKPMINLVWVGFLITLVGMLFSTIRAFRVRSKLTAPQSS